MKAKKVNKKFEFGASLYKKLKDFFDSYDEVYKDINKLREDCRVNIVIGSGLFFNAF